MTGGRPLLTAYRQEALRCAAILHRQGGGVPVHDFETPICIYAARGMRVI